MSITASMRAELRRMVDEEDHSNGYGDNVLDEIIGQYALLDERGQLPYTYDFSTTPPQREANEDWMPVYDLHAAAAKIWQEKAAKKAELYMFSADGGQFMRNQIHEMAMKQAAFHLSRRAPKSRRMFVSP